MKTLIFILLLGGVVKAEQQVSLLGLTIHAQGFDEYTAHFMTHKLTADGQFIYNFQLNYMAINDEGQLFHAALIQDCFNHGAGFAAVGKRYEVEKNFYLGFELGVYMRQVPVDDKSDLNRFMRYGIYQVIPSPAFIAQYKVSEHVVIRAQSNILLNFFDVAWSF